MPTCLALRDNETLTRAELKGFVIECQGESPLQDVTDVPNEAPLRVLQPLRKLHHAELAIPQAMELTPHVPGRRFPLHRRKPSDVLFCLHSPSPFPVRQKPSRSDVGESDANNERSCPAHFSSVALRTAVASSLRFVVPSPIPGTSRSTAAFQCACIAFAAISRSPRTMASIIA